MPVEYEWDPVKAKSNYQKHRIRFADAVTVFADELAITQGEDDFEEERFVTIGRDADWRVLVVVYTWRGEKIRLISARKATNSERRYYESEL